MFDLQMFAEEPETIQEPDVATEPETEPEDAPVQEPEPEEAQEAESTDTKDEGTPPIPDELAGLDEKIAREVMKEAGAVKPAEEKPQEKGTPGPIPYARFKQKVDELAKAREELEALKKASQQPQPQPAPQPQAVSQQPQPQARPQQVQAPAFALNGENMAIIENAVKNEAIRIAQFSKEDVDSLEYMEDDDPRKRRWKYAEEIARGNIFDRIRSAQKQQQEEQYRMLQERNAAIAAYNHYAEQEMKEQDFQEVVQYATNDYFSALPEDEKPVIARAYARIERQMATPEDIYLVKGYITQAKQEYRRKKAEQSQPAQQAPKPQPKPFPRASQVQGAGDAGGGVTEGQLRKMLEELPWEKIPEKYQKILMGM